MKEIKDYLKKHYWLECNANQLLSCITTGNCPVIVHGCKDRTPIRPGTGCQGCAFSFGVGSRTDWTAIGCRLHDIQFLRDWHLWKRDMKGYLHENL